MFNAIIESLDLREIDLIGTQYTWANNLENPMYENLDRVLNKCRMGAKVPLGNSVRVAKRNF